MPFVHKFFNQGDLSLPRIKSKGQKSIYFKILQTMVTHLNLFYPLSNFNILDVKRLDVYFKIWNLEI